MFRYIETRRDDERFALRLEEVNKEMDTLLLRTSRTRHNLDRTAPEVGVGVPFDFYPCDASGGVGSVPLTSSDDPLRSSQMRADLARSVTSAELSQWARSHLPSLIAPLVEAQVQQQLLDLRESVEEVRSRQVKIEKVAKDTAEHVRLHRLDMQTTFAASQTELQRAMEECQRGIERQIDAWSAELRRVQEDVVAHKRQSASLGDRQEHRINEALQRQHAHAQEALEALEHEFQQWQCKMSRVSLRETQGLQEQHHALESRLAQVQGMLASAADMAVHSMAEVRRLMEDAMSRSSEVRLCRRDVNRLELLVQCSSLHTALLTDGADSCGVKGSGASPPATPALFNHLTQEMARLSDLIYMMVSRIDSLDRRIQHVEMVVARRVTANGGERTFHDHTRGADDESLYGRSSRSTRRPSSANPSNATGSHAFRAPTGASSVPSLSENDVSVNVAPLYSGATENQTRIASVAQEPTSRSSGVGGAPGGKNSCATRPGSAPTLSSLSSGLTPSIYDQYPSYHCRQSSFGARNGYEGSQSILAMANDSRLASSAVDDGVIDQSTATGVDLPRRGQRGTSARGTLRETLGRETGQDDVDKATASRSSMHNTPASDGSAASSRRASEHAAHPGGVRYTSASSCASPLLVTNGLEATCLIETPPPPVRNRKGAAEAGEEETTFRGGSDLGRSPLMEAPSSTEDSYVSDTPAVGLNDSVVRSASGLNSETQRIAQYTPVPVSDSESERENLAMARSALD